MITGWVGGVQKGQNIDYVIYGQSLSKLVKNNDKSNLIKKAGIFKLLEDTIPS